MTIFTETVQETFHVVSCYTCSLRFAITSELYRRVVTNATGAIFCPACGKETCWRESEDSKRIKELTKRLEWEAAEVARQKAAKDALELSLNATKGVVTRLRRRVSVGTCPCCQRTFKQLAAHMANKHPEFVADKK